MMALVSEKERRTTYQPIDLDFSLYMVTDRRQTGGKPLLKALEEALRGGVRSVQLREKDLGTRELLRLAYATRELTLRYDARLFINDRVDIAVAVDADGVHLGMRSIPPFAVRRFAGRLIIGVSTHSLEEAVRAENLGADFITLGPVFHTPSKAGYGEPLGLDTLEEVAGKVSIPIFAIGGVKLENVKDVMERGPHGVAMVSGIMGAKEIKQAALRTLKELR
jgi:thiamine-phosphate pyrophosphorylase